MILHDTKSTKHNNSNKNQTLQPTQKCQNWSTQMVTNKTDWGNKIKVETEYKERDQQLLDLFKI